jgi:hypothetical protein
MTDAMKAALKWLRNRGGDGCFPEKNRVVLMAGGERAGVNRATWKRLAEAGLVERYGHWRLRATEAGRAVDLQGITEAACSEVDWTKFEEAE